MDKPKPELTLLPGDLANDLDALVAFFEKLTGRKPTPEDIAETRAMIASEKDAGEGS